MPVPAAAVALTATAIAAIADKVADIVLPKVIDAVESKIEQRFGHKEDNPLSRETVDRWMRPGQPQTLTRWDQTEQCACIDSVTAEVLSEVLQSNIGYLEEIPTKHPHIEREISVLEGLLGKITNETCPGESQVVRRCP